MPEMSLAGGVIASAAAAVVSGQVTVASIVSMVTATPGTERFDWSALFTGLGVLVAAISAAAVAILGQLDRMKRAASQETRLLRRQNEWLHRRMHVITEELARNGLATPAEHAPYPGADDDTDIKTTTQ